MNIRMSDQNVTFRSLGSLFFIHLYACFFFNCFSTMPSENCKKMFELDRTTVQKTTFCLYDWKPILPELFSFSVPFSIITHEHLKKFVFQQAMSIKSEARTKNHGVAGWKVGQTWHRNNCSHAKRYNKNIETLLAKQFFPPYLRQAAKIYVATSHSVVQQETIEISEQRTAFVWFFAQREVDWRMKVCDKQRLQTTVSINLWKILAGHTENWFDVKTASICTTELWDALKSFILTSLKFKVAPHPIIVSLDTLSVSGCESGCEIGAMAPAHDKNTANGTRKCGSARCKTCAMVQDIQEIKFADQPGHKEVIRGKFTCASTNVVHLLTCTACQAAYVGETGAISEKEWMVTDRQLSYKCTHTLFLAVFLPDEARSEQNVETVYQSCPTNHIFRSRSMAMTPWYAEHGPFDLSVRPAEIYSIRDAGNFSQCLSFSERVDWCKNWSMLMLQVWVKTLIRTMSENHFQFPLPPFPSSFFPFLFLSLPLPLPSTFRLRFKIFLFAFIPLSENPRRNRFAITTFLETEKLSSPDRLKFYFWQQNQQGLLNAKSCTHA